MMKIVDNIKNYFSNRKVKIRIIKEVKELEKDYYNAAIYLKLPLIDKHCVWSTYTENIDKAYEKLENAYKNNNYAKEITLAEYFKRLWWSVRWGWLNVIDIIDIDDDIIKRAKGVFKKPVKKWYYGFGINKRPFKPYNNSSISPVIYFNKWSLSWKPKYDYVSFEEPAQVWFCFFKFFWFGYKLVSPIPEDEDFFYSYWEQMIWYVKYSDCDLKKAKETYDIHCGKWDNKYLI